MTTSGSNDYAAFRRALRRASSHLRRDLPWIGHPDPWAVLVSEVMLQQTQTSRVIVPWRRFLATCPTPAACAALPLSSILQLWAGLGYHRRAKALHEAARMIVRDFKGEVPSDLVDLRRLPGVGEYTASAVASFAFDVPVGVLDTNVGRVLARALANRQLSVSEARTMVHALRPRSGVARFNQSMLDLGAQFCRAVPLCSSCPVAADCRWRREGGADPAPKSAAVSRPQSHFVGSNRHVRGRVLALLREGSISSVALGRVLGDVEHDRLMDVVTGMVNDGLIERYARSLRLVSA